jgi:hypothetical protein
MPAKKQTKNSGNHVSPCNAIKQPDTPSGETSEVESVHEVAIDNSFGPNQYQRDTNGLLLNTQYQFNPDGSVDWRAMVGKEHLYPNKDFFEKRGKPIPE